MLESSHLPAMAVQLSDALAAETVDVSYQPIVRLNQDQGMIGVEALLRWTPAFGPHLGASEVIRVAEDSDLIAKLDQYVLRRACLD
ncbi:bifunctional diguanylate cyclase/phosphodiesterase, partial [Mycobacterium sp. ITM-2017-0098]